MPQLDAISSSSVCRVLVISRAAYQSVERAFPVACRNVWSALQRVAEAAMDDEFNGHMKTKVRRGFASIAWQYHRGWANGPGRVGLRVEEGAEGAEKGYQF